MRHCGGMRRQRFGAAQADRKFRYLKAVEELKAFHLAALDKHGEGRASAQAVPIINILLPRVLYHAQIPQSLDLGMLRQIRTHRRGIFASTAHAQLQRLQ